MTNEEFESQVKEAYPHVLMYARTIWFDRDSVEDLVQATLERAWRYKDRYNPAISKFKTWLIYLMRNVMLKQLRVDKSRQTEGIISIDDLIESGMDTEEYEALIVIPDYDGAISIRQALHALGGIHERVVRMSFIDGYTFNEIATRLDLTHRKVRRIYETGLKRLRRILSDKV